MSSIGVNIEIRETRRMCKFISHSAISHLDTMLKKFSMFVHSTKNNTLEIVGHVKEFHTPANVMEIIGWIDNCKKPKLTQNSNEPNFYIENVVIIVPQIITVSESTANQMFFRDSSICVACGFKVYELFDINYVDNNSICKCILHNKCKTGYFNKWCNRCSKKLVVRTQYSHSTNYLGNSLYSETKEIFLNDGEQNLIKMNGDVHGRLISSTNITYYFNNRSLIDLKSRSLQLIHVKLVLSY